MKPMTTMAALFFLIAIFGISTEGKADGVEKIKEGVTQTGKAAVKIGKDVKEGSKKTWTEVKSNAVQTGKAVKEGAVEFGREIKKAFQETKASVKKEIHRDNGADGEKKKSEPAP